MKLQANRQNKVLGVQLRLLFAVIKRDAWQVESTNRMNNKTETSMNVIRNMLFTLYNSQCCCTAMSLSCSG